MVLPMKKTVSVIAMLLLTCLLSTVLSMSSVVAVGEGGHGVVSIAFDDSHRSQFDVAFPLLKERGMVATYYVVTDKLRDFSNDSAYLSLGELRALQGNGSEIASHSKTHTGFWSLSEEQIRMECNVSKQVLESNGLNVTSFAYPYGYTNAAIDSIVSEYYRSGRSAYVPPYTMAFPHSQFPLPHFNLTSFAGETGDDTVLDRLKNIVDQVYSGNSWCIIFFNNIVPERSTDPYAIGVQDFTAFLDYVAEKGVQTLTVNQTLDLAQDYVQGYYRDWKICLFEGRIYVFPPANMTGVASVQSIGTWDQEYYGKLGWTPIDAAKPSIDNAISTYRVWP
jgi:peptidoglycan/xylan/chitin deacetylase (PgdA/CDA1 family)